MRVPYDEVAEEEVVGVVIGSPYGAELIAGRGLTAEDFYKPAHGRLFAVAEHLAGITHDDDRAVRAAELAEVQIDDVLRLVHGRCVQWDEAGSFSRRVQAASRARAAMHALADAFNALAEGYGVDEVKPLIEAL